MRLFKREVSPPPTQAALPTAAAGRGSSALPGPLRQHWRRPPACIGRPGAGRRGADGALGSRCSRSRARCGAVRRPWTGPVRQVLAWPTGWGGAARAARKRPQQAQRQRGFGVDGNWMKTLGVLSPPGGACSSGIAKITPPLLPRQKFLRRHRPADVVTLGFVTGQRARRRSRMPPVSRLRPPRSGPGCGPGRWWNARSSRRPPLLHAHHKDLSILSSSTGSRLRYASDE